MDLAQLETEINAAWDNRDAVKINKRLNPWRKYARKPKQKSVSMLPPIPNYSSPHLKMEPALRHYGRICRDLLCQRPIELPPKAGNAI